MYLCLKPKTINIAKINNLIDKIIEINTRRDIEKSHFNKPLKNPAPIRQGLKIQSVIYGVS